MGSVIASHSRRIIQPTSSNHGCNCKNRAKCLKDDKITGSIKCMVSPPGDPSPCPLKRSIFFVNKPCHPFLILEELYKQQHG